MCGICGIVSVDPKHQVPESTLVAMRDSLTHRGPDDAGLYLNEGAALGSRRLAILDLTPRGHMPMGASTGRYWMVYNGEVYNFQELRRTLEARGYRCRSDTDTEVLLQLYIVEGPKMLNRLNGMFAFAIWDAEERTLFLARDRLGVKPLYYTRHDGRLYFGSEAKALFAAGVPARFDHDTWGELLCFRYVAGERTAFEGVRRLLPGHYLTWRNGIMETRRWWNLLERVQVLRSMPPSDPVEWFGALFDDAVRLRRISDVPVGVLLSGGLDSSSVAASLAKQVGPGVSSFTVRFDEPSHDEGPLARQVVSKWSLEGHELTIAPNSLYDRLRHAAWFSDEPLAHGNDTHLLAISCYAKPRVTVLLSGEGADETLGGYVRYRPLRYPAALRLARIGLRSLPTQRSTTSRFGKLRRMLESGGDDRLVLFNACDVLPLDLREFGIATIGPLAYRDRVLSEARTLYPTDLARQAMYVDQHTFLCSVLDRNDRMTMAASIECRVPFLDYRLVEMLAALPSSDLFRGLQGKRLLRSSLGPRLPNAVLRHPKWGFGVPWKRYFREVAELRAALVDLHNAPVVLDSPLDRSAIKAQADAFLAGSDRSFPVLLQIVMTVLCVEATKIQASKRMPPHAVCGDLNAGGDKIPHASATLPAVV
jgi:asparagine synthase (glutamine-hydrolysing)